GHQTRLPPRRRARRLTGRPFRIGTPPRVPRSRALPVSLPAKGTNLRTVESMADSAPPGRGGASGVPIGIGLKREIGLIGLTWSSMGSIIGSGWLFGALYAAQAAGTAAILSWGIGAVA